MMRKKLVIVGIISAFMLTSSLLIASKVFAEGDTIGESHTEGVAETCPQGPNIDSELCARANQCLDKSSPSSSHGGGVTSEGDTWKFEYDPNMSQECNETLFILANFHLIDPTRDCKEIDTKSK